MHLRGRIWLTMGVALLLCASVTSDALACPMCQLAAESDDRLPRAYMYSILFMLSVPATIATGFGVSLYRLSKKGQLASDAEALDAGTRDAASDTRSSPAPHSDSGRPS